MIEAREAPVAPAVAVPVEPVANAHRNALLAWTAVAGLAGLLALNGCSHAHGVEHPPAAGTEGSAAVQGPNAPNSKPPADRPEHVRPSEAQKDVGANTEAKSDSKADAKDVPLSTSRAGLLEPGAAKKIQERLAALGFLDESRQSGALDEPTGTALRRFQKSRDMVVTGAPDQETVKKLDLDPKDIFKAAGSER